MVFTVPPKCLVRWVSFTLGPWLWLGVTGTRGVTLHLPSPWPALTGELWLRGTRWQVPARCWPGRSVPQPNLQARLSPLGQAAAGAGRRNKERASRRMVGRFWQLRYRAPGCELGRHRVVRRVWAVKLISPWVLPLGEKMAEGACGGAVPHGCILDVGRGPGGGRPARAARRARALAPWPALGPWPAARAAGEGRCERGLCRYITFCCEHPQENQPAALNEALCSALFFFLFSLPSAYQLFLAAAGLPPRCAPHPAERPPSSRDPRGFHTPRRKTHRRLNGPTDLQSRK